MKYIELYDLEFLSNFDANQYSALKSLSLDKGQYEVKIKEIIEKFGITVSYTNESKISGKTDTTSQVIEINKGDSAPRQKFTMAHELGHRILSVQGGDDTYYRFMDPQNYQSLKRRSEERKANNFAANLLMPKKLVDLAIKDIRKENKEGLDNNKLVNCVKEKMNLSYTFVGYRLHNLGIIGEF